jgi:hypothetical protein
MLRRWHESACYSEVVAKIPIAYIAVYNVLALFQPDGDWGSRVGRGMNRVQQCLTIARCNAHSICWPMRDCSD